MKSIFWEKIQQSYENFNTQSHTFSMANVSLELQKDILVFVGLSRVLAQQALVESTETHFFRHTH